MSQTAYFFYKHSEEGSLWLRLGQSERRAQELSCFEELFIHFFFHFSCKLSVISVRHSGSIFISLYSIIQSLHVIHT